MNENDASNVCNSTALTSTHISHENATTLNWMKMKLVTFQFALFITLLFCYENETCNTLNWMKMKLAILQLQLQTEALIFIVKMKLVIEWFWHSIKLFQFHLQMETFQFVKNRSAHISLANGNTLNWMKMKLFISLWKWKHSKLNENGKLNYSNFTLFVTWPKVNVLLCKLLYFVM